MFHSAKVQVFISGGLALTIALCTWITVSAYVTQCCKWSGNSATYTYDLSLPSSFQSAVSAAAFTWTNSSSSSWSWTNSPTPGNLVRHGAIDGAGNTLAATTNTYSGSTITKMDMKFDSAESWYTGSGTPSGTQKDLQSIATHEFGHGLGLSHTQSMNCPGNSTNATMCAGYTSGTTHLRSLQSDDNSGVQFLYP